MAAFGKFAVGLVLVFLIGIGATTQSWFPGSTNAAQQRLQQQAEYALSDAGGDWAQITIDGQKAVLTGIAPSARVENETIAAVKSAAWHGGLIVGGITTVDARTNFTAAPGSNDLTPTVTIAQSDDATVAPVEIQETVIPEDAASPTEPPQVIDQSNETENDLAIDEDTTEAENAVIALNADEAVDAADVIAPAPEPSAQEQCLPVLEAAVLESNITFASASAEIDAPSRARLLDIADAMTACPGVTLQIAGHTDSRGGATGNRRLSLFRADAVATYLRTVGVDGDRLQTSGFGESAPITSNNTPRGRAQNRRIEFTLITDGSE